MEKNVIDIISPFAVVEEVFPWVAVVIAAVALVIVLGCIFKKKM